VTRRGLACLVFAVAACSAERPTEILIRVDAEPATASRARQLRVRVWGGTGSFPEEPTSDVTIDLRTDAGTVRFPGTIPIVPPSGSSLPRRVLAEIALLDASGAELQWARVTGSYVPDEVRETFVCFHDPCLGNPCGAVAGCLTGEACERCADGSCTSAEVTFVRLGEAPVQCPPRSCVPAASSELACGDGMDDDCDGLTDCLDPDCAGQSCGAGDGVCGGESSVETCHDGVDDDCDGLVDCADPDCLTALPPENGAADPVVCSNGLDDDCNGYVDCEDAGCRIFVQEVGSYCSNGVDDDGDGAADGADMDCLGAPASQPGHIWCESSQGAGLPLVERNAQSDVDNCGACYLFCQDRRNTAGSSAPRACSGGHCVCIHNPASADTNGCTGGNFACNADRLCRCTNVSACWPPNATCAEMGGTGGRCVYTPPAVTTVVCR
jgi:hypothetical protein